MMDKRTGAVYLYRLYDEEQHPRDEHGRWTDGGGGADSVAGEEMVSPNVHEGLSLDAAVSALESERQREVMQVAVETDRIVGLDTSQSPTIGAWKDGAENSILVEVKAPASWEQIEASAAMKGMLADQKAVIPFHVENGGKDTMYRIDVHSKDLHEITSNLEKSGLEFHTLEPEAGGTRVWVYDQGSQLRDSVQKASDLYEAQVHAWKGRGSFLGGETRAEARQAYTSAIERNLGPHERGQWQGIYDRWRETHPAVKHGVVYLRKEYDEDQHPRDEDGKWTDGGGGGRGDRERPEPQQYTDGKEEDWTPRQLDSFENWLSDSKSSKTFEGILARTRSFDGTTYRGAITDKATIGIKPGQVLSFKSPKSSSKSESVAKGFLNSDAAKTARTLVMFEIQKSGGADLATLATYRESHFRKEREVVLRPETRYKVVGVTSQPAKAGYFLDDRRTLYTVKLRRVG